MVSDQMLPRSSRNATTLLSSHNVRKPSQCENPTGLEKLQSQARYIPLSKWTLDLTHQVGNVKDCVSGKFVRMKKNCLMKQFTTCLGMTAIFLLNVMVLLSGGGAVIYWRGP